MLRLLIIRHGQTQWNLESRNQGHADIELNDTGVSQAKQIAEALRNETIDALYASDMKRTVATANEIKLQSNVEVIQDVRLRERDYGTWEGKTHEEIERTDAEVLRAYRANPTINRSGGAETGIDVFMRAAYFLSDVLKRHKEGTIAIVTHGGTGSALIAALIHGTPSTASCFRLSNCGITEITIDERGRRKLIRLDDWLHLKCEL